MLPVILILGLLALFIITSTITILTTLRLLFILQPLRGTSPPRKPGSQTHLLVVLGSGGHTAEMLAMLERMDCSKYTHRTYVVGEGDALSVVRAKGFEESLRARYGEGSGSFTVWNVPRARKIHQSLFTTPISCLKTFRTVLALLSERKGNGVPKNVPLAPDLVLANGPATSAIVIFAQIWMRFWDFEGSKGHERTRIVFVESFARVNTLSLSAKCVAWFVDRLVVQWEELKGKARGKAEYAGLVVVDGLAS